MSTSSSNKVYENSAFIQSYELVEKPAYFPALTGLRAIAAFLVFLSHFNPFNEQNPAQKWAFDFVHQGHFGVPIFFVLSGFLIAIRYIKRIEFSWPWLRKYMLNRIARIYPLYFFLTAITFLMYQLNPAYDFINTWEHYRLVDKILVIILNFTFLRGFFANFFFTGISQGWSLTVEETFYILAPIMLLTINKKIKFLFIWPVLFLLIGLALVYLFSSHSAQLFGFFGSISFMFEWTFFGHVLEFVLGIGLAMFLIKENKIIKTRCYATYFGIVWIVACAIMIATLEQMFNHNYYSVIKIVTINFLLPPGICILLFGLIKEETIFSRMLSTKLFDLLGKSSYAFYLIHLGVLSVVLSKLGSPVIVNLFITIVLSIILFKIVEEPMHKVIRNLF